MNGPWFDKFHATHPNIPIGCSEYGCEALNWHTSKPTQGDYTEEYQAYYHEELIKQLFSRKYMWATHVWNMFDFGADARAEGGENGQNHKGLVTFDRKYKKDSFYAYKAWLRSPEDAPFVHLCGKRYVDRVEDVTKVTVYSNLPEVELFANGVSLGKKAAADHFFYFDVPNKGTTELKAVAGEYTDTSVINKVEVFNEAYRLREKSAILNWFDITEVELFVNGESIGKKTAPDHFFYFDVKNEGETTIVARAGEFSDEGKIRKVDERNMDYVLVEKGAVLNWFDIDAPAGRYSLNDKISDIMQSKRGKLWFLRMGLTLKKKMNAGKKKSAGEKKSGGFEVNLKDAAGSGLMEMMGGFTVLRLSSMMGMMNISFTKEELLKLNRQLNRIRKPKNLK